MPDSLRPTKKIYFKNLIKPLTGRNAYFFKAPNDGSEPSQTFDPSVVLNESAVVQSLDDASQIGADDGGNLDAELLPSLANGVTSEIVPNPPLYSEEVFEKLSQLPCLPDVDTQAIPQFFADSIAFGEECAKINHGEEATLKDDVKAFKAMQEKIDMANINESLSELMQIDGAMAVSVVDAKSGMSLGAAGGGLNLDVAAAGNSEVVRAKMKVMTNLGLKDKIEDILITLGSQYHLIRPTSASATIFIYLVLNRTQANLALARHKLSIVESEMQI